MVFKCCLNKAMEKRVRADGLGLEFRVELNPDKPRMVWVFDDLYKVLIGIVPAGDQASGR